MRLSGGSEAHAATSPDGPTIDTELDEVHTGKLGTHDAVVVLLRCGGPGGYAASSADVYLTDGGRLRFLKTVADSDGFATRIRVRFASPLLFVDVSEHPEGPAACDSWKVTTYRLRGEDLVPVHVLEHIRKNSSGANVGNRPKQSRQICARRFVTLRLASTHATLSR